MFSSAPFVFSVQKHIDLSYAVCTVLQNKALFRSSQSELFRAIGHYDLRLPPQYFVNLKSWFRGGIWCVCLSVFVQP